MEQPGARENSEKLRQEPWLSRDRGADRNKLAESTRWDKGRED